MRAQSRVDTTGDVDRLGAFWGRVVFRGARGILARLLAWQELARERRALLELDQRMLEDIGLRREDALREASRPFWDDDRIDWWLRR